MGHEPDSFEFSTLGGWISTRASGMKKNEYGNIEDILVSCVVVTPQGVMKQAHPWPRISGGPDCNHYVLGSEGNIGIITEAIVRVRPIPEVSRPGSILFYDYEDGLKFMHEVARSRNWPASCRLIDNTQFQFGQALKAAPDSKSQEILDKIKKFYVVNVKGYDPQNMVVVTLMFEGSKKKVDAQEKMINEIAAKYKGMPAGEDNGKKGYLLTFLIAYIRDFASLYHMIAESFEASCPWSTVSDLSRNVRKHIEDVAQQNGIGDRIFVSFRVTQIYETGACIYVYFGFNYVGVKDPIKVYDIIEYEARKEILRNGGSVSHHHGIGKIRKVFMDDVSSKPYQNTIKAIKKELDPTNIFAINNTVDFES